MVNTIGIKRNHGGNKKKKVHVNKSLNEMNVCAFYESVIVWLTWH